MYILYFCIAYLLFSLGLMFFYGYEFIVEMIIYALAETGGLLVSCYIIDFIIWWIGKKIFGFSNKSSKNVGIKNQNYKVEQEEKIINQSADITVCQSCNKQYFSYRVTCPYCGTVKLRNWNETRKTRCWSCSKEYFFFYEKCPYCSAFNKEKGLVKK